MRARDRATVPHAQSPQPRWDAAFPLVQQRVAAHEVALVERDRPRQPGLEGRALLADVVAVERVAHLQPEGVARAEARRQRPERRARCEQLAPQVHREVAGDDELEPALARVARTRYDDLPIAPRRLHAVHVCERGRLGEQPADQVERSRALRRDDGEVVANRRLDARRGDGQQRRVH